LEASDAPRPTPETVTVMVMTVGPRHPRGPLSGGGDGDGNRDFDGDGDGNRDLDDDGGLSRHPRSSHPRSLLSGGDDRDLDGDGDDNRDLDGDGAPAAQFVLFSFDPQRDTPRAMRDYAAKKSLPAPRWELLAADDDATLELAVALGVRFQPVAGGDFAHSNIVFVLDCAGEIAHRQEGLGIPPAKAVAAIRAAANNCDG